MVRITMDLIRKRAEHNEGEISTLEEISLHQENIERIELLNQSCRNLKILLMQNNIIGRIENLNMLKKLEYLNLALNNIRVIENLQGLESLKKLDLTINFIGDLRCIKSLRRNENLEILYLTGNPCTDYVGYREYVVTTLAQLKELDMIKIERSERILALQNYRSSEGDIIRGYVNYSKTIDGNDKLIITELEEKAEDSDLERSLFWKEKSIHTPEERIAIAKRSERREEEKKSRSTTTTTTGDNVRYVRKLFNPEGRAYNVNEAKVSFLLKEETDKVVLEVGAYRHLDTEYLEVDVQPEYARVTIKGKILQLRLPCEVSIVGSVAKRNVTTGNLVITMPRLIDSSPIIINPERLGNFRDRKDRGEKEKEEKDERKNSNEIYRDSSISKRRLLEIGPIDESLDFSRIFQDKKSTSDPINGRTNGKSIKIVSENFVDDPKVPPLE